MTFLWEEKKQVAEKFNLNIYSAATICCLEMFLVIIFRIILMVKLHKRKASNFNGGSVNLAKIIAYSLV